MEKDELHRQLLAFPKDIFDEQEKLIELQDVEEEYKKKLNIIRSNMIKEVESEYKETGNKALSTQAKRDLEAELRIKESKAGSLILPKLKEVQRQIIRQKHHVEKMRNMFKAYRAIAYTYAPQI